MHWFMIRKNIDIEHHAKLNTMQNSTPCKVENNVTVNMNQLVEAPKLLCDQRIGHRLDEALPDTSNLNLDKIIFTQSPQPMIRNTWCTALS